MGKWDGDTTVRYVLRIRMRMRKGIEEMLW